MPVLRALRRKFGIATRPVAVRAHVPWYWRWVILVAVGLLLVGAGWVTYDFGMTLAGFEQREAERVLEELRMRLARQEQELNALRSRAADAERQLQIERATHAHLAKQVKSLTEENASLKEDLAIFQTLMSAGRDSSTVSINRFRVEPEGLPGEYRYRLLLVRGDPRAGEFRGRLQFVVSLQQEGRSFALTLPPENDKEAREYQLSFRFFQRIEGTFRVAPDAVVKGMQVRVYENGSSAPRLTRSVNVL
jgi:hypothetical protein